MARTAPTITTLIAAFAVALALAFATSATTAQPAEAKRCGMHYLKQTFTNCQPYAHAITVSYWNPSPKGRSFAVSWCVPRGTRSIARDMGIPVGWINYPNHRCRPGPGGSARPIPAPRSLAEAQKFEVPTSVRETLVEEYRNQ